MPAKLNLDELKKEYIGKVFGWLTVLDVIKSDTGAYIFRCMCKCGTLKNIDKKHVLNGGTKSCGCYKKSKEKAAKYSQWCKENPDKVRSKTEKAKEYFKEHPEQLAEQGKQHSEWLKATIMKDIGLLIGIKKTQNYLQKYLKKDHSGARIILTFKRK